MRLGEWNGKLVVAAIIVLLSYCVVSFCEGKSAPIAPKKRGLAKSEPNTKSSESEVFVEGKIIMLGESDNQIMVLLDNNTRET